MKAKLIATTGATALALVCSVASIADAQTRKPGYLGIRFQEMITRTNQDRSERVVVSEVSSESPAEKAGVKGGDEILRVNGMVATNGKFSALARTLVEGDTVKLRLRRDGKERDATLVAAERPGGPHSYYISIRPDSIRNLMRIYLDSARVQLDSMHFPEIYIGRDSSLFKVRPFGGMLADSLIFKGDSSTMRFYRSGPGERIFGERGDFHFEDLGAGPIIRSFELGARSIGGAELTEMDPELAAYFNGESGLLTLRVAPETPADRAGLQPGDVIVKAKDRTITRLADLRAVVAGNPDGVKLEIRRKGQSRTLELKTRGR